MLPTAATIDIDALRQLGLFGGLSDEVLRTVAGCMREQQTTINEDIFGEGDAASTLYVVLDGAIELRKCAHAGETCVAKVVAGEWFGEVALLGVTRRAVTARVVAPGRLLLLAAENLRLLYKTDIKAYALLMMNLARELARKLQIAEQHMVHSQSSPGAS